jgi:hypothetical protein
MAYSLICFISPSPSPWGQLLILKKKFDLFLRLFKDISLTGQAAFLIEL